jgi:hypothetical protein
VYRAVALAAVCLLAGCSGFAGSSTDPPAETLTPVPVPDDDPRTTASPEPTAADQLAPGVTTEGVVDPFALADAHVAGVIESSYTVERTTTVRYPNGSLRTQETTTASVAAGGGRYRLVRDVTGPAAAQVQSPPGRFELWTDGERLLSAFFPRGGPTEYARVAPDRYLGQRGYYAPPPDRGSLLALLSAFEVRPTGRQFGTATPDPARVRARNGATTGTPRPIPVRNDTTTPSVDDSPVGYRLVGTEFVRPSALDAVGPGDEARNASLELTVDPRGRIRAHDLSYTATIAGERMRVHQRSRYSLGGVRADRPRWYDAALRATNGTTTTPAPGRATAVNATG